MMLSLKLKVEINSKIKKCERKFEIKAKQKKVSNELDKKYIKEGKIKLRQ